MAEPFVKWPGGKRRKLDRLMQLVPSGYESMPYVEPMVGGGAFALRLADDVEQFYISDVNSRLIATYRGVKQDPATVVSMIEAMVPTKSEYMKRREQFNSVVAGETDDVEIAALFIYLNRLCFNGVFRENSKGEFNVPWGNQGNEARIDIDFINEKVMAASRALMRAEIFCGPFVRAFKWCPENAFVYFDPPYVTHRASSGKGAFTSYSAGGFGEADLRLLSRIAKKLVERKGCKVMISHSDTEIAREVFDWMGKSSAVVSRSVSQKSRGRGAAAELVFTSYR